VFGRVLASWPRRARPRRVLRGERDDLPAGPFGGRPLRPVELVELVGEPLLGAVARTCIGSPAAATARSPRSGMSGFRSRRSAVQLTVSPARVAPRPGRVLRNSRATAVWALTSAFALIQVVELGGIEPPSVERSSPVLRPFPGCGLRPPPRRVGWLGGDRARRRVFARCQRSFPPPAVFPAVIPYFCCRAVGDRPRVPSRVAMSLFTR